MMYYGRLLATTAYPVSDFLWLLSSDRVHHAGDLVLVYDTIMGLMVHEITGIATSKGNDTPYTIQYNTKFLEVMTHDTDTDTR